jgi:Ribose/xylose/arabinose/galactoside ABC-type transport systems, permease components
VNSRNTETRKLALANARVDNSIRSVVRRTQEHSSVTRMFVIVIGSLAFFTVLQPTIFLNPVNLQNIYVASPEIGVIAIAMMLAMLTGGIDLSLIAIANMSAITITTL